ncbi:MAG: ribonuclease III [Hyphomicrobiales bacterium]|nr:ribonuclease III [Hyphomicrobiales bacterium]
MGGRDLDRFEKALDYTFSDRALLELALTHVSATNKRLQSYQRLEFLGDRVLGLAVANMLFIAFPQAEEGELSRRLADLVRKETCADVAREWAAARVLKLGEGEAQSGGAQKAAILGDICEAVIGAVFIDGGYDAAATLVERAFGPRMTAARSAARDPKSALQEWAQGLGHAAPAYSLAGQSGPDHAPTFIVAVAVGGYASAKGEGPSKRAAEQAAAEAFMTREKIGAGV